MVGRRTREDRKWGMLTGERGRRVFEYANYLLAANGTVLLTEGVFKIAKYPKRDIEPLTSWQS